MSKVSLGIILVMCKFNCFILIKYLCRVLILVEKIIFFVCFWLFDLLKGIRVKVFFLVFNCWVVNLWIF